MCNLMCSVVYFKYKKIQLKNAISCYKLNSDLQRMMVCILLYMYSVLNNMCGYQTCWSFLEEMKRSAKGAHTRVTDQSTNRLSHQ